jgi:hypothetical protein
MNNRIYESVYRSPKWMQRFADFELRTGEDIKGEPSEKEKKRIEEENKKKEQQRIENELLELINKIVDDFNKNPWNDKYSTPIINGITTFKYRFENGHSFEMNDDVLIYIDDEFQRTYRVGLSFKIKFINIINDIIKNGVRRPNKQSNKSSSRVYEEPKKTGDTKRDRYNSISHKIIIREEQLKKMSKNDPERKPLENELDNYKKIRDKMKSDYKFENISSFNHFNNSSIF